MRAGKGVHRHGELFGMRDVSRIREHRDAGSGKVCFDCCEPFHIAIEQPERPAVARQRTCELEAEPAACARDEGPLAREAGVQSVERHRRVRYRVRPNSESANHPIHAPTTMRSSPGNSSKAYCRFPITKATTDLLTELVVKAIRIANAESSTDVRSPCASAAAEIAAACGSPNPANPLTRSKPRSPSQCVAAVDTTIATPMTSMKRSAVFGSKGRPRGASRCSNCRTLRQAKATAYATAANPARMSEGVIAIRTGMLTRPTTMASCRTVATEEAAAPATAPA